MSGCRTPQYFSAAARAFAVVTLACVAQPLHAQDAPLRADSVPLRADDGSLPQADAVASTAPAARGRNANVPTPDASADETAPDATAAPADASSSSPDTSASAAESPDATAPADANATPADATAPTDRPIYYNQSAQPPSYGVPGLGIVRTLPSSDFGTPQYGVPYSSVIGNQTYDPFSNHNLGVPLNDTVKTGNAEANIQLGYAGIGLGTIPFIHHATAPQDADLKLGPLYFFLDSLSAGLLYTDNYNLSDHNRKSETLAVIALNMTLVAQLTEDLQFSVTGALIYLPIQNILGFESSSLEGSLGFLLAALPALTADVSYDTIVAGWPVQFRDDFRTATGSYSDNTLDSFTLFQGSYLQQGDGKYVFHSGRVDLRNNNSGNNSYEQNNYFNFFANTISATTFGYLPSDIAITARAARSDFWYNQGDRGLPSSRDDFYILAQSQRPNMRFQPFASYEVEHTSDVPGVYQIVGAGFSGPINNQLFLYADFGYFRSNTGNQGYLYRLDLAHTAGEDTTEDFSIERYLNDFDDEVITTEYYRITQRLGPTVSAIGFADHATFEELSNDQVFNRSQEDFGVGIDCILGPLTRLQIQGVYDRQTYANHFSDSAWTGRVNLSRTISDTMHFEALYQYQNYRANQTDRNYYQNIVFLSLVKYFH